MNTSSTNQEMLSYPPRPNLTMSSSRSMSGNNGRITSADWKDDYKDVEMVDSHEFDASFFDLPAGVVAVAAAAEASASRSRQTSASKSAASVKSTSSGTFYPPMPTLGKSSTPTRGLSTESWFNPDSLPAVAKAAERITSTDFVGQYILGQRDPLDDAPAAAAGAESGGKRKRTETAATTTSTNSKKKRRPARKASKAKRPRTDSVPDTLEDAVEECGDNDVAMGRGGKANNHEGNKRFRDMAKQLKPAYEKLPKEEKTGFSIKLVQMVHDKGGRFLSKDAETGLWYEVDFKLARKKASQALREENRAEREIRKLKQKQQR
mmetsp:Transcript_22450/g.46599  ORF Transcript_22450/g.46599 Transcript_22450/m.46599 type:complete len:321 (+) Transcript_22450:97-1059(+)